MKERKRPKYNRASERTSVNAHRGVPAARRTTMVQNARSLGITHRLEHVEAFFYKLSTGVEEIWTPVLRDVP
jgi:hypothetical protein